MALLVAIIIVAMTVNHAFRGTNPSAFIGDIIGVLILTCVLASC